MSRRWLIIAHSFNADGRAASQTVTDKIPYLIKAGITPIVISSSTGTHDARFPHYQRLPWGPAGLRFDLRHIIAARYGKGWRYRILTLAISILLAPLIALEYLLFGLPNHASWFLPALWTGLRLVRRYDIELIYSSGGVPAAHQAAAAIKRLTRIRWIAEVHDPMIIRSSPEDDGSAPAMTRRGRYYQSLERRICRGADHVWWFTPGALAAARQRHPELGERGFYVLPGADPPRAIERSGSDHSTDERLPGLNHTFSDTLSICHFGAITDDRSLAPLIDALAELRRESPGWNDVVVRTWGSALDRHSHDALERHQLQSAIEVNGRLSRTDAVRRMYEADCLLLLHGDHEGCAEYIPSKLYEYLWTGRPVFAMTHRNPELDELLTSYGAYVCHPADPPTVKDALRGLYRDWRTRDLSASDRSPIEVADAVSGILDVVD